MRLTRERWVRWKSTSAIVLRWAVPALLLALIAYNLTQIGWNEAWKARPASPIFYLLAILAFFIVPSTDYLIYRYLWRVGRALPFSVLLRKRFLNFTMLSYSGEAYFLVWARQNLKVPTDAVLHAIKDSNLLSAGAGYVVLAAVLAIGYSAGALPALSDLMSPAFFALSSISLVLCGVLVIAAGKLTILSRQQVTSVFVIHLVRGAIQVALDFATLWLSGSMLSALVVFRFVMLRLVVSKVPSPSNNLLVVGVGVEAAKMMHLALPAIAATFVIMAAAGQILNFAIVGLPWLFSQRRALPESRATPAISEPSSVPPA